MVNRVVCALWGSEYSQTDVERLKAQVTKNCSVDFTFHVFDDFSDYLELESTSKRLYRGLSFKENYDEEGTPFYFKGDLGGVPHWRKITLFDQDKIFDDGDRILYLDLDTVITGDIAELFKLPNKGKPYIVWNYWWEESGDESEWLRQYHVTRCPMYNSSVMLWTKGTQKPIYDFLVDHMQEVFFTYPSMDTFMFHQFGPYSTGEGVYHYLHFPENLITTERERPSSEFTTQTPVITMLEGLSRDEKSRILRNIRI